MRPIVIFHGLWLLSERDESASRMNFNPSKNLLAGGNETGKSRVLKHLVWALGCEPTARAAGGWDLNIVAALDLSVGNRRFTFIRHGRHARAAFDQSGALLIGTERAPRWAEFFAQVFDYNLKLQKHQDGGVGLAGPEYAVLPYYIDQEGGWGRKWTNFMRLTQFSKWEAPVFESFTGLRPLRYFEAQLQRDDVSRKLQEARANQRIQGKAFDQVSAMLPESETKLDEALFATELHEVRLQVEQLAAEENSVREAVFELTQQRQEKQAELQLAARSEQDLVGDLAFLSKVPDDGVLTCPTCGQAHGSSFRARFELAGDAKDAHQLVLRIRSEIERLRDREQDFRAKLVAVTSSLERLKVSMSKKKDGQSVSDIVAAKSRTTLELAYDRTRRDLLALIDELETEKKALQDELDKLTEKGREKRVRGVYKEELVSFADRLGIAKAELGPTKIGARPPMATGSSGPRVYLAMHMALLSANRQFGDGPEFPFIVDTPRQQGLDEANTAKLLTTIFKHAQAHQVFVANESVPGGWDMPDDCVVLTFKEKRQVLRTEEYKDGLAALAPWIAAMDAAIAIERAASAAPVEDDEAPPVEATDDDDEHEDG